MKYVKTYKKRIRVGFDGIVNSSDESVTGLAYAKSCHNFAFEKGVINGKIGIDPASGYYVFTIESSPTRSNVRTTDSWSCLRIRACGIRLCLSKTRGISLKTSICREAPTPSTITIKATTCCSCRLATTDFLSSTTTSSVIARMHRNFRPSQCITKECSER